MKISEHLELLEQMLLYAIKNNDREAIKDIKNQIAKLKLAY